ncbi:MAG: polysaccharide deacetylase family protein [Bryobacteraceae bacterium]
MRAIVKSAVGRGATLLLRRLHGSKARLLTYHGVPRGSQDNFARQCKWLKTEYHPVSMDEYVESLETGKPLPAGSIVVTFDDGLLSLYRYGVPVLREHRIPAIVYVVPAFARGEIWLWWHVIQYAFRETRKSRLDLELDGAGRLAYTWSSVAARDKAAAEIEWRLHRRDNRKTLWWAQAIARELDVTLPSDPPEEYAAMTWEQLKEAANEGILVGSHTVNHTIMGTLPNPESKRFEAAESKKQIEQAMGRPCSHFSFPNGGPNDQSQIDLDVVQEAGYQSAVSTYIGFSDATTDPFFIPRINAGADADNEFLRRKVAGWFLYNGTTAVPRKTDRS